MKILNRKRAGLLAGASAAAVIANTLCAVPAYAVDFEVGGWSGTLDTALIANATVRTDPLATALFGPFYGGNSSIGVPSFGDLNFKQGDLVSQQNRVTPDLLLKNDETTIFLRATAFYDPVLSTGSNTDFMPLSRGAIDESGHAFHLLDAFIDQKFDLAGNPSSLRIGNQVLNFGESTFIQGGINSASPLDLTAIHAPGVELKDVILPIPAVDFKTSFGPNYSLEAYYQFLNVHDRLDGAGTFFGSNNVGNGGSFAVEGGTTHNPSQAFLNFTSLVNGPNGVAAPFGYEDEVDPTHSARNLSDEFGLAFRTSVPELQDAELAFYFENFASRAPFIVLRTGAQAAVAADELGLAHQLGLINAGASTSYFATSGIAFTFPQDIHLIGVSFNFNGPYELAFQGEVSSRLNQPITLALSDSFLAVDVPALCDTTAILAAAFQPTCQAALADPVVQAENIKSGDFNQSFQTYKRFPVSQAQFGVTKLYSDIPGTPIETVTLIGEAALDHISGFPKASALLNDLSTNAFSGFATNPALAVIGRTQGGPQTTQLPSDNAYGYVLSAAFEMPRTLPAGIDMTPTITFQHDVQGTSPTGAGNFIAHTASISVGVNFKYLENLTFGINYVTNFNIGGSPEQNPAIDQDFVSAFIGYQF
jgi:Protein of unknown function (DUF1302)